MGSPPPTRGTRAKIDKNKKVDRITPAYAGNTDYDRILNYLKRDHPRLRGEHYHIIYNSIPGYRITPAYAGNTKEMVFRGG